MFKSIGAWRLSGVCSAHLFARALINEGGCPLGFHSDWLTSGTKSPAASVTGLHCGFRGVGEMAQG